MSILLAVTKSYEGQRVTSWTEHFVAKWIVAERAKAELRGMQWYAQT